MAGKKLLSKTNQRAVRPQYSEAFRRKVVSYSVPHGIAAAAEKYNVSTPSVTNWRKLYGVSRALKLEVAKGKKMKLPKSPITSAKQAELGRRYSPGFKREVAEFSALEGITKTASRFGVSVPSVTNWRREFGISRKTKTRLLAQGREREVATVKPPSRKEIQSIRDQLLKAVGLADRLLEKYYDL